MPARHLATNGSTTWSALRSAPSLRPTGLSPDPAPSGGVNPVEHRLFQTRDPAMVRCVHGDRRGQAGHAAGLLYSISFKSRDLPSWLGDHIAAGREGSPGDALEWD